METETTTRIAELKRIITESFQDNSVELSAKWCRAKKELEAIADSKINIHTVGISK